MAECQSALGLAWVERSVSAAPLGARVAWRRQAFQPGFCGVKVAEPPWG